MNVFNNITSIFKRGTSIKSKDMNLYMFTSGLVTITLGLFGLVLYRINQIDFSKLQFPIF